MVKVSAGGSYTEGQLFLLRLSFSYNTVKVSNCMLPSGSVIKCIHLIKGVSYRNKLCLANECVLNS